ncbi:hypothetical protein [Pontivivens ytuae]|uniref:Protein translocase subunit SecA n=1 Tax=Pontivivens ytuae TaxID=2789856 RepID=A0A7S9QCV2_9RHOB|nr:hypothetical protein [Pontivivens ytuae]QPH54215.1 hypothetical protein I0K15_00100 [Pontivivens ytuae]
MTAHLPPPRGALPLTPPERAEAASKTRRFLTALADLPRDNRFTRRRQLAAIRAARGSLSDLDDTGLRDRAAEVGAALRQGELTGRLLVDAFALIDEAFCRETGFRFHDTQLLAGLHLARGRFVEMATGEGKTFTAALPAALHALAGCAVHVVTVNDYLAERDAAETAPILARLGLTSAHVIHGMELPEKRAAYAANVTYCTNKELVFDYLKDRAKEAARSPLAYRMWLETVEPPLVTRLDYVIVDEADSVLIDEANIPLILTEPTRNTLSPRFLQQAMELAERDDSAWEDEDDLGFSALRTEALARLVATLDDPDPEWQALALAEEVLTQARAARDRFRRDTHYIVEEEKIVLVDQQTGRPMPDRSLPFGLQQILEVREGLEPSASRKTLAKLSFQLYFRKYHKIAGMSGTMREVRAEMRDIYRTGLAAVPTHKPVIRQRLHRRLFSTTDEKLDWAVARAEEIRDQGRPVLLGVSSVQLSEALAERLRDRALPHDVLNARRLAEEAEIVAEAGQGGRVTVVTNMAGRGTDIKLSKAVKDAGGLHVVIADALESDRLDRQLYGRAGRQGDPGSYDIVHALDEPELKLLLSRGAIAAFGRLRALAPAAASAFYFRYLAYRRNRLEGIRRSRRVKLLKSEEKRDEMLSFTRRR